MNIIRRPFAHTSQNHAFKSSLDIQHHLFTTLLFFSSCVQTSDVQYQDTSIIQQHASIIFADTAIKAIVLRRHAKVRPSGFEEKISMPNTMVLR